MWYVLVCWLEQDSSHVQLCRKLKTIYCPNQYSVVDSGGHNLHRLALPNTATCDQGVKAVIVYYFVCYGNKNVMNIRLINFSYLLFFPGGIGTLSASHEDFCIVTVPVFT